MSEAHQDACFLGIDAGTTSCKAALFDAQGYLLGLGRREYQLLTPGAGLVELDAEVYWQACYAAVQQAVTQSEVPCARIAALAVSSQGETLIAVDAAGRPLRRAIVWLDNRAQEEARTIAASVDVETVYHTTGQPEVAATWPACKILWLRQHEPQVFATAARFLLLEDYLLYRLTGQFATEYSLQTSSLLLDINERRWWQRMLDCVGLQAERLARLEEPGTVLGPLSREGAEATGLAQSTVAVTGGLDQVVGAAGAGNIRPGVVTEMTGGALAIVASLDAPRFDPLRRVPCHYHVRRGAYCLMPWSQTAGMALKWYRDAFFGLEAVAAGSAGRDLYDEMTCAAGEVPAGAEGLVMLPHLEGAACPEFNPAATGAFYGLTLRHTKAHFTRAILESVAYMLKKNLALVQQLGVPITEVRSIGGGARSRLWLQIKADVLQIPVRTLANDEVACLGAALLAATAVGRYASLEEGAGQMVRVRDTIEPQVALAAIYAERYAQYNALYACLEPMFGGTHPA